ncbi:MAG: Fe-S cluster assembly protein SufD [Gemmatimonadaceae bacterium]
MTHATYVEDFAAFSRNGGGAATGPAWLGPVRRRAIDQFESVGFPTMHDEDWHFTSVAPIAESRFATLHSAIGEVRAADVAAYGFGQSWPTVVFVNGRHAPALSSADALPAGVRVRPLADALREMPELVERHLTKITAPDASAFTALNTAFMTDGAVIHVGTGVRVSTPIHLLHVTDAAAARVTVHPRNLVIADANADVTVIESYVALGNASYFTNAVTEIAVGDGATVRHYKIQQESPRAFHVGTAEARQGRDSHYISFSFATGAALARTNVYTTLAGAGCGATLNGLYMIDGDQHCDHQTRIEHVEPHCYSREVYKGILDGASHGVFNGKVYVHPAAQKTDGKQTNNTLLLSDRARVDTKPQLEIFADDVKCTHGATVGRLDATSLFYMKSRGIGAELARKLLTYAFAADVLETIEVDAVREGLERATLDRYAGAAAALVP